jgi:hypothetical protein
MHRIEGKQSFQQHFHYLEILLNLRVLCVKFKLYLLIVQRVFYQESLEPRREGGKKKKGKKKYIKAIT